MSALSRPGTTLCHFKYSDHRAAESLADKATREKENWRLKKKKSQDCKDWGYINWDSEIQVTENLPKLASAEKGYLRLVCPGLKLLLEAVL